MARMLSSAKCAPRNSNNPRDMDNAVCNVDIETCHFSEQWSPVGLEGITTYPSERWSPVGFEELKPVPSLEEHVTGVTRKTLAIQRNMRKLEKIAAKGRRRK